MYLNYVDAGMSREERIENVNHSRSLRNRELRNRLLGHYLRDWVASRNSEMRFQRSEDREMADSSTSNPQSDSPYGVPVNLNNLSSSSSSSGSTARSQRTGESTELTLRRWGYGNGNTRPTASGFPPSPSIRPHVTLTPLPSLSERAVTVLPDEPINVSAKASKMLIVLFFCF